MADALRQQLLNLLPLKVGDVVQGVGWTKKQLANASGLSLETVSDTIKNLATLGAVVTVGGDRKTGFMWAKTLMRIEDRRGRHNNHTGGRPRVYEEPILRRLAQVSRGPSRVISATSTEGLRSPNISRKKRETE